MSIIDIVFTWFYYGLGGLGGWLIFFLLALAGMIWLLYDSSNRRLPAPGWRLGVILTTALILPAIIYRFTIVPANPAPTSPLVPFSEPIFYLGILGGILPVVLAVSYYVAYQGMVGCPQGHVYEAALGQCPYDTLSPASAPSMPHIGDRAVESVESVGSLPQVRRRHVNAWLVTNSGKNYQLYEHETSIGRSVQNDIQIKGDTTVARIHAKIVENNGKFCLFDMGSKNYSRVNGKIVRAPIFLEPDDQIQFGDSTIMQFVTARRHSNEALPKPEKITNNLLVSIAYPQLLSKGRSSKFLVTFYNKKFTSLVKQHIENSMSDYQKEGILIKDEVFTATNLDVGKKLQVKLSSSEMDFSDEKAFQLNDIPSSLIFLGKPKETCRPDKHLVLLTVSQDGVEILSETCQIKIVDYAFDHISRPFLAQVGSLFIGISSLAAYMLALLEKTDTAFGFTTGTAGLFIAGSIYSLVYFRYQQLKKKLP